VLCDKKILLRLNRRVYHVVIRPTLLYGAEALFLWVVKAV